MAGGGGEEDVPVSPRARQPSRGGHQRQQAAAACLPLDVVVEEIAARSDATTPVRCAATCRDARRRIAGDPDLRARLRLRDTGRFLLPLMRGLLMGVDINDGSGIRKTDVYMMDAATARLAEETETFRDAVPMDSRGGLVLARVKSLAHPWQPHHDQLLRVCNLATRRSQNLPPEPAVREHAGEVMDIKYVLLVGDGDGEGGATVGRAFRVLKVKLMLCKSNPLYSRLLVHTFSSEHGAWSPLTEIPTPNIRGSHGCWASSRHKVLVIGDVVHWLYLTDSGSYLLMLHVRAARVDVTALPANFPRNDPGHYRYSSVADLGF